jgi:TolB-like protein
MAAERFVFPPFLLDTGRATLARNGEAVAIGHRAFLVLQALLSARGQLVTKSELMTAAWPDTVVEESNLTVQIAALRKLLGPSPEGGEWIATVSRIGYRFAGPAMLPADERKAATPMPANGFGRKPAIAVLPFVNLSGDPTQEYFADGITEDIITALSRFRWFFVIARNSSFFYKGKALDVRQIAQELGIGFALEGSVRKSDQRVRISAQLVDAANGNHIWAERYDFDLLDMFTVQDQIAEQVAGAIEPELLKTASAFSANLRRDGNITAWDLVRQGTFLFHQVTRANHLRARELFREARALAPDLPEGYVWLARVSAGLAAYGWSLDPAADLREGLDAAVKAIELEEKSPYSHYALAITSVFAHDFDQAIRAAERAVELSPSFALGYLVLGMARLYSGQATSALEPLQRGFRLNPHDPQNVVWYNVLALAHFFAGDPQQALRCAVKAAQIRPTWRPTLEIMACCHVVLGHPDAAHDCVTQMATLDRPAGDALGPLKIRNPHWVEEIERLLREVGKAV